MNIHYTTQFKKDFIRIKKQNKDPDQLKIVIKKLVEGKKLEPKYSDHPLKIQCLLLRFNTLAWPGIHIKGLFPQNVFDPKWTRQTRYFPAERFAKYRYSQTSWKKDTSLSIANCATYSR